MAKLLWIHDGVGRMAQNRMREQRSQRYFFFPPIFSTLFVSTHVVAGGRFSTGAVE